MASLRVKRRMAPTGRQGRSRRSLIYQISRLCSSRMAQAASRMIPSSPNPWVPWPRMPEAPLRLRKRGYAVTRERIGAGGSVYRISGAPDGSGDRVVQTEAVDGRRDPKRKTKRSLQGQTAIHSLQILPPRSIWQTRSLGSGLSISGVRETEFCGLRLPGDIGRGTRENGRNLVRRPGHTSLTDGNCAGFCKPGSRPGLSGLHGGGCRNRN